MPSQAQRIEGSDTTKGNGLIALTNDLYAIGVGKDIHLNKSIIAFLEDNPHISTLKGHTGLVTSMIELDANRIASCSVDKTIKIWDIRSASCLATLEGHADTITALCQLADGSLASGCNDGTIKIWDLKSNTCTTNIAGHSSISLTRGKSMPGIIHALTQLDDRYLASASADHSIKIWDLTTGTCQYTLEGHTDVVSNLLVIKNDGGYHRLVSTDFAGHIQLWDISNLESSKPTVVTSKKNPS